jgi:hypothetical protein
MRSFCSAMPARWRQHCLHAAPPLANSSSGKWNPSPGVGATSAPTPLHPFSPPSPDSTLTFRDIVGQDDRFPALSSSPSLSPLDSAPPSWYTYAQWLTSVLSMLQSAGPQLRRASSQRCGRATEHPGLSPIDPHPSCPVAPKRRAGRARRPSRPRAEWPLHAGVDLE